MATVLLSPNARLHFDTAAGAPAVGYKLYTYAAGTANPQATYSDRAGTVANTNPIILDALGNAAVYLTPGLVYDYKLTTAADVLEWTQAGVIAHAGDANALLFTQTSTGAVERTVASKLGEVVSIADFGGVGNNTTDNITAFALAEASPADRIYMPEGRYYTTGALSLLKKHYHGPGYIRTSAGDNAPGRFSWVTTRPVTGTGTGYTKFLTADLSRTEAKYVINNVDRTDTAEAYFAPETSMGLAIYDNRAGHSGTSARLTAIAALGATSATLNSAAGFAVGDVVGFNDGNDVITNVRTLTAVAGNVITWVGGLIAPAPYAVGARIAHGVRTMHSMNHLELQHRGGGDAYINLMRVEASYVGTTGQDHAFFRSTAGVDGGDLSASSSGVYLTGRELTFEDNGFDVAVLGDIRTFNRTNATGALQAFWHGYTMNSSGAAVCDAAYVAAGKWKTLFDSSRMDSSTFGGCVGNMASDQYFYWGSTGDAAQLYESWGRNRGTHRFGYSSGLGGFTCDVSGTARLQTLADRNKSLQQHEFTDKIFGAGVTGEYSPTAVLGTNAAAAVASADWMWTRIGDFVDVYGQITIDPTAASTSTIVYVPFPVASNIDSPRRCVGVAVSEEVAGLVARVSGDSTGDRAMITLLTADTANRGYGVHFRYKVM